MNSREKRFVIEIGLGILFISTAISVGLASASVVQTSSLKNEVNKLNQQNKVLMENLKRVTQNDIVEKLALKKLKEEIIKMSDYMQETVKTVEQIQKTLPNALIVMSTIGTRLIMVKNMLIEIVRRWKEN